MHIERRSRTQRRSAVAIAARVLLRLLLAVLLVLTLGCIWASAAYDNISLEEVLFYLTMPLRGTAQQFSRELVKRVLIPSAAILVLFAFLMLPRKRELWLLNGKGKGISLLPLRLPLFVLSVALVIWLCILLPAGDRLLNIRKWADGILHQSTLIEERYVDPASVPIGFPEKKRNLITIYIESAETTNQDEANGGLMDKNYTPEMTRLCGENVSFSRNNLFAGATVAPACGWTVAGMVAETAGLPLKLFGYNGQTIDNMGYSFAKFLPGATMMGDILFSEGYRNVFLCGSDFDFGGRRQMYARHGQYEIYDYWTAMRDGWIPDGYYYSWGFEDVKMYSFAKNILAELAQDERPFHLGLLTVDTHDPGWLCELCREDHVGENIYARAVRCSSRQVWDFVEWCKTQPFYEDTTIVITGDHSSMTANFYAESAPAYDKHHGTYDRLVYNCFINAVAVPEKEKNRKFTTMDFFPTTLAAIGCTIEGERLGLGTNLFSGRETLSEELGEEKLFDELNRKSIFYDTKLLR